MEPILTSIANTAKTLDVGRTTVYLMLADGRLDSIKLGSRRLVKTESIRRLIDSAK
jgi:excisionase family DNA binding protein